MNRKSVFVLFIVFLLSCSLFAENKKWTIGAEKFTYSRGQTQNSITDATAESLPVELMEKLGNALIRTVLPDEALERTRYELRKERLSLFLQLSSEHKKRDAIFLNDYTDRELKNKLAEADKSVLAIQEKIDENLKKLSEAEQKTEKNNQKIQKGNYSIEKENQNELKKFTNLFRNLISKDGDLVSSEDIGFYQNDNTKLVTPSEKAKTAGYDSYAFESEMVSSSINTLLTGVITNYGQYMSLTVTAYAYPGGKIIGTITEVGSMQEKDLLITSVARQLVPVLTNAMPVVVNFIIKPEEAPVHLYIDDIIQNVIPENMIIDSGVHNLQFVAEGFESVGTNYFFTGNERYNIEINLAPKIEGHIKVGIIKPITGDIYTNGIAGEKLSEQNARMKINGQTIIGEFIAEDGKTDFYFVPPNLIKDDIQLVINPKPRDRSDFIEKRRKWMYRSYSVLITSLIPSFYTYGNYYNQAVLFNQGFGDIEEAIKWQKAYKTCSYISMGCGAVFVVEMLRYFQAADSVLPRKAKKASANQKNMLDSLPPIEIEEAVPEAEVEESLEDNETSENQELAEGAEKPEAEELAENTNTVEAAELIDVDGE